MRRNADETSLGLGASALILMAAALALFADVLFVASPEILSRESADLASQYVHWRAFGFGELSRGNLALWNPHIYLGTPYLGGFQSALLYPPNWIHLILPLPLAINWGIALHVFLTGLFACAWARQRGLTSVAALVSGLLLMFCGAHFLHVCAGHLSNLCTMAWAPLLFLAIDGWLRSRALGWVLLGAAATALMILAGHPQYVFYSALAAGLYSLLCLLRCAQRARAALGLLSMAVLGSGLAAVQLLPGLDAARESVRSGGTDYEFASTFSLPPENLLTLFCPYVLGEGQRVAYWGRTYLWEAGLFIGVTGVFSAAFGALRGERSVRRFSLVMSLALLVLALGAHTPLFRLLHAWLPGFDRFRGSAKFAFLASVFVTQLAGIGLDRLLRGSGSLRRPAVLVAALALLCAAIGSCVLAASHGGDPDGTWAKFMQRVWRWGAARGEAYLPEARYHEAQFIREAGACAAVGFYVAATTALLLALFLIWASKRPQLRYAVAALAVLEVFAAARMARPTFELSAALTSPVPWDELPSDGDQRILNPLGHNQALSTGALDVWGYDPGVSKRYAELMAATQGVHPDQASQYVSFRAYRSVYRMLRLRHVLLARPEGGFQLYEGRDLLPRLLLVHEHRVLTGRDPILQAMSAEDFDPRRQALLENEPTPRPEPALGPEDVRLIDSSSDHLTIEAHVSAPALLVVTDGYSAGWTARSMGAADPKAYPVLPANYVLRAVPLDAGQHTIRMEYAPASFRRGKWITFVSLLVACVLTLREWRRAPTRIQSASLR